MTTTHTITFKPGKDRWLVKTGTDPEALQVNPTPVPTTIAALRALPAPIHPTVRVVPAEYITYCIEGTLSLAHAEGDGDVHSVIGDVNGNTMICEFPDPDFVTTGPWVDAIKEARQVFANAWGIPNGWITPLASVRITGPLLWDRPHGQTGGAPNSAEIHPVLLLELL